MTYRQLSVRVPGVQARVVPRHALGEPGVWEEAWCPEAKVAEWAQQNTVPIFNNKWNWWLIKVQSKDAQSNEEAKNWVRNKMEAEALAWFHDGKGRAENCQYEAYNSPAAFENANAVGTPIRDAEWTVGPKIQWEDGPPPIYVAVSFIYRGNYTEFPWPVYRSGMGSWCPVNTNLAVYRVYPPEGADVPEEDPCASETAWRDNPNCLALPLRPQDWLNPTEWNMPWWGWVALAGGALYLAGPLIVPVVRGVASVAGGAVSTASKALTSKRKEKKDEEATPNRAKRCRKRSAVR